MDSCKYLIKITVLLTFLCLIAQPINAQPKFESYSIKQGLAHTHVLSVFQDSKGLIWFGTYSGLHLYNGYSFQIFTSSSDDTNSISNNTVNVIFEDRNGYMWFGSAYGLNKYNRKTGQFKRFLPSDSIPGSISHHFIKTIHQDSAGNLWIGTYGGGLNKMEALSNSFKNYTSEELGVKNNEFEVINTVIQDENNTIWVGTEGGGVFLFDMETGEIKKQYKRLSSNSPPKSLISALHLDQNNDLWAGTWDEGLYLFNRESEKFEKTECHPENEKNINKKNIRTLVEDDLGNLWIAHYGAGLTRLNISDKAFTNYYYNSEDQHSISSNYLWSLHFDNSGILWVGTFGGGLNKFNTKRYDIPLYSIPSSLSSETENNGVSSVLEDNSGTIWIGTLGSGVYKYSIAENSFVPFKYSNNKQSNIVHDIYEDFDKQIWIGTDYGLFKIDSLRKNVSVYLNDLNQKNSISREPVTNVFQDKNGNIWLGTWNAGINMLTTTEQKISANKANFIRYQHNETDDSFLSDNIVYSIFEDSEGKIWIGTAQNLEKLDIATGKTEKILSAVISSIHEYDSGYLWIATLGQGLYMIDKQGRIINNYNSVEQLTANKTSHLPNSSVLGQTVDNENNIWVTTNEGISLYDRKSGNFQNYTIGEDLGQNALILNSITTCSNGALFVGGIDGFNIIWPDSLRKIPQARKVLLTDIKISNGSIIKDNSGDINAPIQYPAYEVEQINLDYTDDHLLIEFASIEYNNPGDINYAYKLDGFDENWIYTDAEKRYAFYSNLDPGVYTFLVKGTNSQGVWLNDATKLIIRISPPVWETIWFRMLFVLVFFLLVVAVIRYRTRSLLRQKKTLEKLVKEKTAEAHEANERKLKFFTSMSHEFRTPLTLILGPLEHIRETLSPDHLIENQLSVIQKNAHRLLRLINEILDLRKLETNSMRVHLVKDDLVHFITNIYNAFKTSAIRKTIDLSFSHSQNSFITWFDPGKIEIILYNLISNALHFAPANGKIKIRFAFNSLDNKLLLSVEDTGKGIDSSETEKIFERFYQSKTGSNYTKKGTGIGLSLTKEIVELLNGNISVVSISPHGTRFNIELPVLNKKETTNTEYVFDEYATAEPNYGFLSQFIEEPELEIIPTQIEENTIEEKEYTILLVEDDKDMRSFIKSSLMDSYKIYEAENGNKAIDKAKTLQPNLILSDIMMPEMDGIEFCKMVKGDFSTSHIPIILLSAQTTLELQLEGFETGADAFIPKPFSKKYLETRVKAIINSRDKLLTAFIKNLNTTPKEITVSSVDEIFLNRTKEIIEKNLENPEFGVDELSSLVGVSRTLLHMKLKKLTNCSTGEFIRIIRLKRACQLLKKKSYRVSDICYMVGFNDPQSFSKSFKKQFGETPTQYTSKN